MATTLDKIEKEKPDLDKFSYLKAGEKKHRVLRPWENYAQEKGDLLDLIRQGEKNQRIILKKFHKESSPERKRMEEDPMEKLKRMSRKYFGDL
jgi:hypothetical protein